MVDKEPIDNAGNIEPAQLTGQRIIMAGGGTGGHIFPAIAIAKALQKINPGIEILFVGAKGKMEMEKVPEAGYKISGLTIAGYNRNSLIKNLSLPFKLIKSFYEVNKIFKSFKPTAVVGVGGYSSFPVLRVGQLKNIPTFIHESNSLPGRSNIILGKKAKAIFVASDNMEKYFPSRNIAVTGNPVRDVFLEKISKEEALKFFGLTPDKKTIVVMGGSLGARSINETIEANINLFRKNNLQLIWQTGKSFAAHAAKVEEDNNNIWTNAFITKMEYAYAAADVVVARSGAMTIAELAVTGKPAVFVPYPFAAEDHQAVNANALVEKMAGLMVRDAEAAENLMNVVLGLVRNDEMMNLFNKNISKMAYPGADEAIAQSILNILEN